MGEYIEKSGGEKITYYWSVTPPRVRKDIIIGRRDGRNQIIDEFGFWTSQEKERYYMTRSQRLPLPAKIQVQYDNLQDLTQGIPNTISIYAKQGKWMEEYNVQRQEGLYQIDAIKTRVHNQIPNEKIPINPVKWKKASRMSLLDGMGLSDYFIRARTIEGKEIIIKKGIDGKIIILDAKSEAEILEKDFPDSLRLGNKRDRCFYLQRNGKGIFEMRQISSTEFETIALKNWVRGQGDTTFVKTRDEIEAKSKDEHVRDMWRVLLQVQRERYTKQELTQVLKEDMPYVAFSRGDKWDIVTDEQERMMGSGIYDITVSRKQNLSLEQLKSYLKAQNLDIKLDYTVAKHLSEVREMIRTVQERGNVSIPEEKRIYQSVLNKFKGRQINSEEDVKELLEAGKQSYKEIEEIKTGEHGKRMIFSIVKSLLEKFNKGRECEMGVRE